MKRERAREREREREREEQPTRQTETDENRGGFKTSDRKTSHIVMGLLFIDMNIDQFLFKMKYNNSSNRSSSKSAFHFTPDQVC